VVLTAPGRTGDAPVTGLLSERFGTDVGGLAAGRVTTAALMTYERHA
jgi:hypothetical protein